MGCKEISLKLPTDYTEELLRFEIEKKINLTEFSYQIKRKSLDARKKDSIHWLIQIAVSSKYLKNNSAAIWPNGLGFNCRVAHHGHYQINT